MADSAALTPEAVRERMLHLETEYGAEHPPLGEVAARLLGAEPGEEFDRALISEASRTELLCADWYARRVAVLPNSQAIAVAMVQGITFAVAVRELLDESDATATSAEIRRLRVCIAAALERVEVLPSDDGGEAEAILREALAGRPDAR